MTFGGFGIPDEIALLRDAIGRFVQQEIVPIEKALPADAREIPLATVKELQQKAKALGFWCLEAPPEYGGGGLSTFASAVIHEEAAKHKFSFPVVGAGVFGWDPPVGLYHGTQDQIERWVIPCIENGWSTFSAISESSASSDPARNIRTRARLSGDKWVINGHKMWATNADEAAYGMVFARTDNAAGRAGISAFIVEAGTPGMVISKIPVLRDHHTTEITFDNCEVPASHLVGTEGEGFVLSQEFLARARLHYASQAIGAGEEALRMAIEWSRERETFGALIATRQGVQFPIADSRVELNAARWLTWEAAWKNDSGENTRVAASIAKLYGTEMGYRVLDRCIQIMGGMGLTQDLPLEHWFRALRVSRIVDGASEIHRYLIARDLIGPDATGRRSMVASGAQS
jgi:acyl-CoA dehydrogenase